MTAQHERGNGAEQDLGDSSWRRPVGGVGTPNRSDHGCGDDGSRSDHDDGHDVTAWRLTHAPEADERNRPDPIELLFDRKRPVVLERRCRADALLKEFLVRTTTSKKHPVSDLQQAADGLSSK